MARPPHRPNMFTWKRLTRNGAPSTNKVQLTDSDINQWMKRVEMASEFAVSEVFSSQKARTAKPSQAVALESIEQLQDHDDAYSEAQAILSDWMNTKLRLELEMNEEEEELIGSSNTESPEKRANRNYNNFDDMYSHLVQEDESFEVNNFLEDLMETDVLESGIVEGDKLDTKMEIKHRDPSITMQVRHQQVKERRLQRDAARERQRKEQETKREAREEAYRLEREEQRRRKQEACRQEELLQQEMMRLRQHLEEKRNVEQLARKMERERLVKQPASQRSGARKPDSVTQKQLYIREQEMEARVHILSLQCMQKHFSAWYSVVLEKRVRMGKAAALCDWRRQLMAWRAWRALVWVKREEREAERVEEELRVDKRRCQVAAESDRRRLLRRCLNDWRLWCRLEKERRELLNQQEETRCKMVALINAAASGKLTSENCADPPVTAEPDISIKLESSTQCIPLQRTASVPASRILTDRKAAPPSQAWQVTRHHVALSPSEIRQAIQRQPLTNTSRCVERGGRFEHRHMTQQQTIAEQRRLLKEQQDLISHLKERQLFLELRQEAERQAESTVLPQTDAEHRISQGSTGGGGSSNGTSKADTSNPLAPKTTTGRPVATHPAVRAMEVRAQLRAERRREVEAIKKKREEEKLTQMKAAEQERLRQEEEEKFKAVERKKEERRQQKERELEKKKRIEREKKLLKQAQEHYDQSLLLHRGLAPWKRLLENSHTNFKKAEDHHSHILQRQCLLSWLETAREALAGKEACANQMYTRILLRRAFCGWKRFNHLQFNLKEQAEHFHRAQTLRKVFTALLDHTTHQRLLAWKREQQAEEHNARWAVRRCFFGWRRLPAVLREERVREVRREQLRQKVAEILPDFRSLPVDSLWSPSSSH